MHVSKDYVEVVVFICIQLMGQLRKTNPIKCHGLLTFYRFYY